MNNKTETNRDLMTRIFLGFKQFFLANYHDQCGLRWLMMMITFSLNGRSDYFGFGVSTPS